MSKLRSATATDDTLINLGNTIMKGWPELKQDVPKDLLPYFNYRDELTINDGIVYRGYRIAIPISLRREMKKVHIGHLGINSCLSRARDVIFWPGISAEIRQYLETCGTCATFLVEKLQETLIITDMPDHPWKTLASDLFSYGGKDYLMTTDYHSNFFEVGLLNDTSSETVINKLKAHFARSGTPDLLITDNGPPVISSAFKEFAKR